MPKKLSLINFIEKAQVIHGGTYNYAYVNYVNNITKVLIKCHLHGIFKQSPRDHLQGSGCPECGIIKSQHTKDINKDEFIQRANKKFKGKFDYSVSEYINYQTEIDIICQEHGRFTQRPQLHLLTKYGCPSCGHRNRVLSQFSNTEHFISKSQKIHGFDYDYSLVNYIQNDIPVILKCQKHGVFEITPSSHLAGHGCRKCSSNISISETRWLDSLSIPEHYRQKVLYIDNKKIKADAYDPVTKTIYEYNGDFWHGNPLRYNPDDINPVNKKTFGTLYTETLMKRQLILAAGYTLVEIWDSEWQQSDKYRNIKE